MNSGLLVVHPTIDMLNTRTETGVPSAEHVLSRLNAPGSAWNPGACGHRISVSGPRVARRRFNGRCLGSTRTAGWTDWLSLDP